MLKNRELSWLDFNRRVLAEAWDERNPLLERVRFLSIVTSNLDEFFMNRVASLRQKLRAGVAVASADGLMPSEQLAAIRQTVMHLIEEQAACYETSIEPQLAQHGIFVLHWNELSEKEQISAQAFFERNLFPILTPQAVDPGRPFPAISNLSQSLGVIMRDPTKEDKLFARVKIPNVKARLVRLDGPEHRFLHVADIIQAHVERLFSGMQIESLLPFRLTRNADLAIVEDEAEDLLELIKEELRERRFAQAVRLECGGSPDPWGVEFLRTELELSEEDIYPIPYRFDLRDLQELADLPLPSLRHEPWVAPPPPQLADEDQSPFGVIATSDVLVHHPYESFSASVERFLRAAVEDPKVLSIKMTLYRTGDKSTIVPLLVKAAELNKQVVCLIEIKAHFDEATNIQLAEALEAAGVYVMYGVLGLKTHAKVILVSREEHDEVRCYAHIGTGNYNPRTARLYTDLGLFTADRVICDDLLKLFNFLTGRSRTETFSSLLVAPFNMRERFLELIEKEKENARAGRPARIVAKMNGLEDQAMCLALDDAAASGVEVTLIVRGLCCLRAREGVALQRPSAYGRDCGADYPPAVRGKPVRILSVLGRFLEHSRVFHFANGEENPLQGDIYLGSADWMQRNLSRRVEVIVPVKNTQAKVRLWEVLSAAISDHRQAWEQQANGEYRRDPAVTEPGSQDILMSKAKGAARLASPVKPVN